MANVIEHWTLDQQVARMRTNGATARVDVSRPELGLQSLQLGPHAFDGRILALTASATAAAWPATIAEAYVRGADLVASYVGDGSWPFSPQVYWRAGLEEDDCTNCASLGLTVSIQTDLLDTHPRIDVRSSLRAEEVLLVSVAGDELLVDSHVEGVQSVDPRATACGIVWRLANSNLSYAEIMPRSDFRQLAVVRAGELTESRWQLFAEFLEKGVIRRARLQSLWVPRENDVQLAGESCQQVERRPLPLTT